MDIEKIVTEVVGKLTGNQDLVDQFMKDPAKVLKEKFNISISDDQVKAVVTAVKAKLGVEDAKGLFNKVSSFLGK